MNAASLSFALALAVVLVASTGARGEQPKYDEFGRRPPQGDSGLSIPDPMLDSRWPMPEPGASGSKAETIDSDEERLDPLHEEKSGDYAPPVKSDDDYPSVEELLRRGPATEGVVAPAPLPPTQEQQMDGARRETGAQAEK